MDAAFGPRREQGEGGARFGVVYGGVGEVLTVAEVADLLKVSKVTVYAMVE